MRLAKTTTCIDQFLRQPSISRRGLCPRGALTDYQEKSVRMFFRDAVSRLRPHVRRLFIPAETTLRALGTVRDIDIGGRDLNPGRESVGRSADSVAGCTH